MTMPLQPAAIVIGAGVAGLATAIRLAVQGFAVKVFEKNNYPGGKIAGFNLNGYRFDEGPSLFTQPANIEELFALAGKNMSAYFQYRPLPIACRYFYENGKVVDGFTDPDAFADELNRKLGEDGSKVFTYLEKSAKVYNDIGKIFLNYSLHHPSIMQAPIGAALRATRPALLLQSLHNYNSGTFERAETIQLFNRFATYNGSNPYQAPAMLSLIPHLEHNIGTFYPRGGMISIAEALYRLACDLGVAFYFDTPVERILVKAKQAVGVATAAGHHFANVVVSNMDVYFTYKHLLQNEALARRVLKQERSSSAIIFYWGMQQEFRQLYLHNIFFTKNYRQEFEHIFKKASLYHDPTVYINITSKMEAQHAPAGCENWFVMVNAPANSGQNWQQLRGQYRMAIVQKLNRLLQTDIEPMIAAEQVMDPADIEQKTSSYMGSLYGTSSNSRMAAFLRHPNFSSTIKGLYFAGGSVHPGGGIPLCLHSAKLVANLVSLQFRHLNANNALHQGPVAQP